MTRAITFMSLGILSGCFFGRHLYVHGDPAKWLGWLLFLCVIGSLCLFGYGLGLILLSGCFSS